jgi:hypothetical protein
MLENPTPPNFDLIQTQATANAYRQQLDALSIQLVDVKAALAVTEASRDHLRKQRDVVEAKLDEANKTIASLGEQIAVLKQDNLIPETPLPPPRGAAEPMAAPPPPCTDLDHCQEVNF